MAGRLASGLPAAAAGPPARGRAVTAAASWPVRSGRAGRPFIVFIGSHGTDAEEYDHDDDEHDRHQADEEKHSTTQQAMAAWLAPARRTRP